MIYFVGVIACHPYDELVHYGVKGMKWGVHRTPEELGHIDENRSVDGNSAIDLQLFSANKIKSGQKYTERLFNEDGTIVVTDDWKNLGKVSVPRKYKPYAVIETVSGKHRQIDRTIYDGRAYIQKQIHSEQHLNYTHPTYKNGGAHAHGYRRGVRVKYANGSDGRNLTGKEVREHADIIKKPYGRRD